MPEAALTKEEFGRVLTSPEFIKRIRKIANFTINETREGGMAIYKSAKGISFSPAVTPELEAVKNELSNNLSILDEKGLVPWGIEYVSFDPTPLIYERMDDPLLDGIYDPGRLRTDVALTLHSHPSHTAYPSTLDNLCPLPSEQDLATYEWLQSTKPKLIESVLAADKKLGRIAMLFWRLGEGKSLQPTYLHILSEASNVGRKNKETYMKSSGLNLVRVDYALRPTEIIGDPVEVSSELFA